MEAAHPPQPNSPPPALQLVTGDPLATSGADKTIAWLSSLASADAGNATRLLYVLLLKRGLDLIVASLMLVVLSPLLLLAALAVRLDTRGPILYRQTRVGRRNRPFTIYKFRTMAHDPGATFVLLRDDDGTLRHKVHHDPRITRTGKWLRRTSVDELPQLFNVLLGHMSLVGPRPELPQIVAGYESWQHQRHLVRPGLTGWWQVSGRGDRPMHEHTALDIYYVENLSFWLDVRIALRTVRVVLNGLGAF